MIRKDIERYIFLKRSDISIKYGNFCRKHFLAPLQVKLHVLNMGVAASITYACETWGVSPKSIETIYRQGLKSALSIRESTNNEIVYLESGELPLEVRVTKQQLKFWEMIVDMIDDNPDNYIAKLVKLGENTSYIRYYKQLRTKYTDPISCMKTISANFKDKFSSKIHESARLDVDSKLGKYLAINPTLSKASYVNVIEFQRILISRYRTGAHNLRIEKDRRLPNSK